MCVYRQEARYESNQTAAKDTWTSEDGYSADNLVQTKQSRDEGYVGRPGVLD